ncbi:MAG TPA: extracellular solute-binding protein [Planctomycetota bacterium]|jgi:multiple sugar transport system permease protein
MMNSMPATRAFLLGATLTLMVHALTPPVFAADAPARRKVVFWNLFTAGDQREVIGKLVDRFNQSNREHFVELVDIPYTHIHSKMLPAIAGGTPPDVSVFDRYKVASYAARNAFLPLDDRIKAAGLRGEDFFDAPWGECFYSGQQFAVPYDTDVRVLYYNKKAFREAGLDPEKPPRTWSDLREYSKKLTKRRSDGHFDQVGFVPIWGNVGALYLYGWQRNAKFMSDDGRKVRLNDPRVVEALEWIRAFVLDYGMEDLMTLQSGFGAEGQNPFISGRIAMIVLDVGELSTIQKYGARMEWGAAPCPHADDGVPATWSGGFSLVIPTAAKNVEGAWAFSRFILSEESQRFMATSSNKLPALRSAANDPFFTNSPFWRLAIDQMKYSHYRPITPIGAAINDEMLRAVEWVSRGKLGSQEALDIATRESQKLLDQFLSETGGTRVNWPQLGWILGGLAALLIAVRAWSSYKRIRKLSLQRGEALAGYAFAAPAILGLIVFTLGPILATLMYSLMHYEILDSGTWVGADNYSRLFTTDRFFVTAMWNTLYFTALSVPLGIAISLGLALLLNMEIGGRAIYRTCFYLPTVVPAVAGSLLWRWMFNPDCGVINVILFKLGLPEIPWLTSEFYSKPALIVMGFWSVGGGMIIFLAALQGVPRQLYEAAEIDGAGLWSKFRNVTLPMISPAMFFMLVMGVIGSLQVFTQAYLVTEGGPGDSTLFYVLYLFREAFQNLHMGYAAAMAWVLFLVILIITGVQFVGAKRWVYYEGSRQ